MNDWFRFSVAFWLTFRGTGGDPFGAATKYWPWEDGTNSVAMVKRRMRANFEFLKKLGVDWWCFHDRDIAPDGNTLEESNKNLDEVIELAKELQKAIHEPRLDHCGERLSFSCILDTCTEEQLALRLESMPKLLRN
ncbi:xylose isomerase-like isoform X2 [Brassica rapa]|nr:xylose isomerase-like isoform X2 [Brassica rapa]XP_018512409.2 xylose isomerase-like isoform X2 [Brassica rapa]